MNEMIKMISEYGLFIVISALFIWDWLTNKKTNTKTLQEIRDTNKNIAQATENTAKALEIIQNNQVTLEDKIDRNFQEIIRR